MQISEFCGDVLTVRVCLPNWNDKAYVKVFFNEDGCLLPMAHLFDPYAQSANDWDIPDQILSFGLGGADWVKYEGERHENDTGTD